MLQCNWNSNSDRNSDALERSDWRGKISEIKVSKQPSQMLTMEWNMVHMHNGRVCANMSALIIITINIWRLECCKVSTRNQVDVHIAHSWPATRRIEVFERRSPWNQPSTHFSYSVFFSSVFQLSIEDSSTPVQEWKYLNVGQKKRHPNCKPIPFKMRMKKKKNSTKKNHEWDCVMLKICICRFFHFFRLFCVTFIS